jgi:tetratricopeptide (TPR) repeat protein
MAAIDDARAQMRAGRLGEAERILRGIVAANPEAIDATELLGASLGAQGRHAEALPWFDRAVTRRPGAPGLLHNRALALLATGRAQEARADLERVVAMRADFAPAWTALGRAHAMLGNLALAESAFRKPVALNPASPDALYNLGFFLQSAERFDEAIAAYRQVLRWNPNLGNAHNNLANALRSKGLHDEALKHYGEAARLSPGAVEALSNYGAALHDAGRDMEAIPVLEQALQLDPKSAPLLSNLGVAYFQVYRFADAEAAQRTAIELAPEMDEGWVNLGNALAAQGRHDEAIAAYRVVIARNPANPDAHGNLGLTLQEMGDDEGAMASYRKALELRADHPDALNNLGFLLQEHGRRDEAMGYYERALRANPRYARAEYNLGMAQLTSRDFAPGWRHCEVRFSIVPPVAVARDYPIPRFTKEDIGRARKVFVWQEQGIGDQIVYATMLPDLEARGVPFALEVDARLVPAFRRAHPQWEVGSSAEAASLVATSDRHIPIASLGPILRPDVASFAAQPARLLAADPARVDAMRAVLRRDARKVVGISWRSFQPKTRGLLQRRKSAGLAAFARLSRRDDLRLVDLQYGDTAAEHAEFSAAGGRIEHVPGLDLFKDIDGVLAAIEACDLVITTSNVTAHYAGALGKETYLVYLGNVPPCHYWAADANGRGLWYPTVRIVTGAELTTWEPIFERVERDLA